MAANNCRNFLRLASIQGVCHVGQRGVLVSHGVTCFPAMGVAPPVTKILGVRYAYQPKARQQKNEDVVPSYRIGVTKGQDSHHTGNLKGSLWASERMMDDIMIRKLVEGVMHEYLVSEIVIKRRANCINIVFLVPPVVNLPKFYFLVGFTETLLTEMLECVVKLECQSSM